MSDLSCPIARSGYGRTVARVLVTGMSGAGKTSVLEELGGRGYLAVDTDYDGWTLPDGTWDEPRMAALLATHATVIVGGAVDNQGLFYDRFEHVVLLTAPPRVLIERVSGRSNNPYGKTPEQRAEILRYVETVEPLLRRRATLVLDSQRPLGGIADVMERLVGVGAHQADRDEQQTGYGEAGQGRQ